MSVAVALAKWKKVNTKRGRISVVTQGKQPILVAIANEQGEIVSQKEYPIATLSSDLIVDTNGAGDSFTGGFLSQIALGKDIDTAVAAGMWLSGQVIQRSGCTFPETNQFQ